MNQTDQAKIDNFNDLLTALKHTLTCKMLSAGRKEDCDECLNAQMVATLAGLAVRFVGLKERQIERHNSERMK